MDRLTGAVEFVSNFGYGYVVDADGTRYHFPASACVGGFPGFRQLQPGDGVSFEVSDTADARGPSAVRIAREDDGEQRRETGAVAAVCGTFGFLRHRHGGSLFFSAAQCSGFKDLRYGTKVSFIAVPGRPSKRAVSVQPVAAKEYAHV
jgi:cold shock CspA family protein